MSWLDNYKHNPGNDFDDKLKQSLLFFRLCDRVDDIEKAILDKHQDCAEHKAKTSRAIGEINKINKRHDNESAKQEGIASVYKTIAVYGSIFGLVLAGLANFTKILETIVKLLK